MIFFVPARKGSKRVEGKNMMNVCGRPLIDWTFHRLAKLNSLKVFVSSDDQAVLDLAGTYGFEIDKRISSLCDDKAKMSDVLLHYTKQFENEDAVCILYPTSLLRTEEHIAKALNLWKIKGNSNSTLMSVTPVLHRPYGLMEIRENGLLKCCHPYGELFYQSQSMPVSYRANGAIYIIPTKMISSKQINSQLFCKNTIPFVMDTISGHEVDESIDVKVAECYLQENLISYDELFVSKTTGPVGQELVIVTNGMGGCGYGYS